jgi:hypothetical protein
MRPGKVEQQQWKQVCQKYKNQMTPGFVGDEARGMLWAARFRGFSRALFQLSGVSQALPVGSPRSEADGGVNR